MLVFMIWILRDGCLPFLSFSVQMILWVCYTWELPFAVSLLFARDELYSEGKYVTARFLWTLTRVLIFWHHRMLSFMSIQSLLVSLFIDLSCDHLYTVLLFIYDLKSILFISCALWHVFHPTIDCLWLGFIPSFISCSWLFAWHWIHCLSLDFRPYTHPAAPRHWYKLRPAGP